MSLCMNCHTHGTDDMEVISNLIKIRLKPKVLLNHYMLCVRSVQFLLLLDLKKTCSDSLTDDLLLILQGAAQCAQRQPGHHGEAGDLQRAVQCQESQQHASSPHSVAAQPRAGSKGEIRKLLK